MLETMGSSAFGGDNAYARDPQRSRLVDRLLKAWNACAGVEPVEHETGKANSMNQMVNRRAVVAASTGAAAIVFSGVSPSDAMAAPPGAAALQQATAEPSQPIPDLSHVLAGPAGAPASNLRQLESAFNAEWDKLEALSPAHSDAEEKYMAATAKIPRPVMPGMSQAELEAMRQMTLAEIGAMPRSTTAGAEYKEASKAYERKVSAARRRTGFGKIERAYERQMERAADAAYAVLNEEALTLADVVIKVRVHQKFYFTGDDFAEVIADDIVHRRGRR